VAVLFCGSRGDWGSYAHDTPKDHTMSGPSLTDFSDLAGLAAFAVATGAFFLRRPRTILAVSFAASLLWAVHFGLLAAWAGIIVSIASAIRNAAGAWLRRSAMIWLSWTVVALVIIAGLMIDPAGWVVLLAAPARAISNHLRDRDLPFRIACAMSGLCYVLYGLVINSPALWGSSAITVLIILAVPLGRRLVHVQLPRHLFQKPAR
jgi:hypothetical protein